MFGSFLNHSSFFVPVLAQAEAAAQTAKDLNDVPFWQNGFFIFGVLLLTIFLATFLSKLISGSLRLPEYRSRMTMVLMPLFVALLMITYGDLRFGVDLRGGVNYVGSLNLSQFKGDVNPPTAQDIIGQLNQRVNPSGTLEIAIRPLGEDKIEVTIPDVTFDEADAIWDRLVSAGKLEFRIVADFQFPDHAAVMKQAAERAKEGIRDSSIKNDDGEEIAFWAPLARIDVEPNKEAPKIRPYKFNPGFGRNLIRNRETGQIVDLFRGMSDIEVTKFFDDNNIRPQILIMQSLRDERVNGSHLANVSAGTDQNGGPNVNFETGPEGATRMGLLTGLNEPDAAGNKKLLGILLDGKLHSAPTINDRITGRGEISGAFTVRETQDLANKLKSGKLDAALNKTPISRNYIESLLGKELQRQGVWAIGGSLVLVLIFMIIYYRFAGVVAALGLVLNIILIMAVVMAIHQPLTLTGLAGLVLTVGMSVDANVLIFERIREEMERGSTLRMAIRNGFDKARTTIVDANLTTLITALVLYTVGTEQVKGFAVTLILGIVMSMFTAIFCSRLVFDIWERKRWLTELSMTKILDKQKFDFISKISVTGVASALIIGLGLLGMTLLGSKILDLDLRGGSTIRLVFSEEQTRESVQETLDNLPLNPIRGEDIEFDVSGFGSVVDKDGNVDPSQNNRNFRIDSNLPAWEGGDPKDRWQELPEVMAEAFAGKLLLHKVKIIKGTGAGGSADMGQAPAPQQRRQNASWNAVPAISSLLSGNPTLMLQESGTDAKLELQDDLKLEGTETPVVEPKLEMQSTDSTPAASATEALPTDSTPADSAAAPAAGSGTQELETGGGGLQLPGGNETDDKTFQGIDNPVITASERVLTETTVEIKPEILGKSLRAEIVATAKRLDLELTGEDIILKSDDIAEDEAADGTVSDKWEIGLKVPRESDGAEIIQAWSTSLNTKPVFPTSSKVGSQIASTMQFNAILAILFSLLGIIAYIWARFQNIAFGLAAVVALLHDVLFVLGMIALSHYVAGFLGILGIEKFKISLEIIAALLTVIGYSLNDTIVVFDRIREVRGKRKQITSDMINTSISQTLSRTILTSVTTFVVVFILYWFGGSAIHGFAFSLVIGVIVGTYSSIFIASPALLWLMNTVGFSPEPVEKVAEAGQI